MHDIAYPFDIVATDGLLQLNPTPLWRALLDDLDTVPSALIAARFHAGLANALVNMVEALPPPHPLSREAGEGREGVYRQVALSGGVFQNRLLLEQVSQRLEARGLRVLTHRSVPANDGGLALGQAAIAAARMIHGDDRRMNPCAWASPVRSSPSSTPTTQWRQWRSPAFVVR